MDKLIIAVFGAILLLLSGCIITTKDYSRPKPKAIEVRAKSYFNLGVAYMSNKRYDLAEPKLQNSIRILPTAEAYNALAVLYEEQHYNLLAEEAYKTLLDKFPDYALGYINYYVFLCKYNRQKQIDIISSKMISKGKDMANIGLIAAGNCAFERGNKNKAKKYYNRALKYDPYSEIALLRLAEINYDKGFIQDAKKNIDVINNRVGYSARSVYLAALINKELGNILAERKFLQILKNRFANSEENRILSGN